jgi:hypothetical protein
MNVGGPLYVYNFEFSRTISRKTCQNNACPIYRFPLNIISKYEVKN